MTVFKIFIVAAALLLCPFLGAAYNCTRKYQRLLREVEVVKAQCPNGTLRDCCQLRNISIVSIPSGQYEITDVCSRANTFGSPGKTKVRCDMETDRGGWIVIQRRVPNGRVNFYRRWKDYEDGFGDLDSEFWYGLQNLHCLTTQQNVELQIDAQDKQGNKVSWVYQQFSVDGPDQKYRLHIGQGTGTRGSFNPMAGIDNMYFSTLDRDNDLYGGNCALSWRGAWWYNSCAYANLNGLHSAPTNSVTGIAWLTGTRWVHYPSVEMKVRPKTC